MQHADPPERPRVVVGVVIVDPQGRILVGKSPKWHGKWTIFGGHVEHGERLEEAAIREVREEAGLIIHAPKFLGVQESIEDPDFHKPKHFIFIDFWAEPAEGSVTINEEFEEYEWCSPETVFRREFNIPSRKAIEHYLRQAKKGE